MVKPGRRFRGDQLPVVVASRSDQVPSSWSTTKSTRFVRFGGPARSSFPHDLYSAVPDTREHDSALRRRLTAANVSSTVIAIVLAPLTSAGDRSGDDLRASIVIRNVKV